MIWCWRELRWGRILLYAAVMSYYQRLSDAAVASTSSDDHIPISRRASLRSCNSPHRS